MSEATATLLSRCALCEVTVDGRPDQCVTDCGHVFCVSCACRYLGHNKNRCSVCQAHIKIVRQMDAFGNEAQREKPCSVKFCNVTYILYVSIWSVDDPTSKLASLFYLDHARLIHQGKIIKKGDVWPGTVVQLVGTKKDAGTPLHAAIASSNSTPTPSMLTSVWATLIAWAGAAFALILSPLKLIYLFFHSMVHGDDYQALPQRRYAPPVDAPLQATTSSFQLPGAVPLPPPTDTVE
ncbi:hypothetical protein H257_04671 [Aphanomyces astaci]|uniref:RING-type domain-containing protein n=2 Tax=Aphanomyces astaci TaxID=112090 RepID=W4GT56_APHAT|nr:hypothetical protein H257_04671 [Aphanomyces astaci]ETV82897.1 hypothetical protein H257_04671 [Aphanomyces astaci]|eukprot:XP_009827568.1 hypothetical protein H257_04671 [Aphanomyces astaci]